MKKRYSFELFFSIFNPKACLAAMLAGFYFVSALPLYAVDAISMQNENAPVKSANSVPADNTNQKQLPLDPLVPQSAISPVKVKTIPAKAIKTPSNVDFFYLIEGSGYGEKLTIYEKTKSSGIRVTEIVSSSANVDIGSLVDVSPDGKSVIYDITKIVPKSQNVNGKVTTATVRNIATGTQWAQDHGGIKSASFNAHNEVVLNTLTFPAVTVDLKTLQTVKLELVNNSEINNSPDGIYGIKDERATGRLLVVNRTDYSVREVTFNIKESPIMTYSVTEKGVYYVTGHDTLPKIMFVPFSELFASPNVSPNYSPRREIRIPFQPKDRNSVKLDGSKARIAKLFGSYTLDLVTGKTSR